MCKHLPGQEMKKNYIRAQPNKSYVIKETVLPPGFHEIGIISITCCNLSSQRISLKNTSNEGIESRKYARKNKQLSMRS